MNVLIANQTKLLHFLAAFKLDKGSNALLEINIHFIKHHTFCRFEFEINSWVWFVAENEQFEEDKALVVKEIAELELKVNQWPIVNS